MSGQAAGTENQKTSSVCIKLFRAVSGKKEIAGLSDCG